MQYATQWSRALWICALALGLGACQSMPETPATNDAGAAAHIAVLQPPAWLERGGLRKPLQPGIALRPGDWVLTGKHGRVHIGMQDGSTLELGSAARLEISQIALEARETGNVLWGSFHLHDGALRHRGGADGPRDLNLSVGGVIAARVQGSDVCARVEAKRAVLCLVAGQVEAQTEGGSPVVLDKPHSAYLVPRGAAPQLQSPVAAKRLSRWLADTGTLPDRPQLLADGTWGVGLIAEPEPASGQSALQRAWAKGYPARLMEVEVEGRLFHRVALLGFTSAKAARNFLPIAEAAGYPGAWVFEKH